MNNRIKFLSILLITVSFDFGAAAFQINNPTSSGGLPSGVTSPGVGSLTGTGTFQAGIVDKGGQVFNVVAYGASGSNVHIDTCAPVNGVSTMVCGSAGDLKVGDAVYVGRALAGNGTLFTTLTSIPAAGCSSSCSFGLNAAPTNSPGSNLTMGHDDSPRIQAAIDAAYANTNGKGRVYFPAGNYVISTPLHDYGNVNLECASRSGCTMVGPTNAGAPMGPQIVGVNNLASYMSAVTFGTNYWQTGGATQWFDLRDSASMELNGKTNLAIQVWFFPTSTAADGNIIRSGGTAYSEDGYKNALFITQKSGGAIQCGVNVSTSGAVTVAAGGAVSTNAWNLAEIDLDSATGKLYCYLNGTQTGTAQTATGSIVQAPLEMVTIGDAVRDFPENNSQLAPIAGRIGPLLVKQVSLHTANYTAPSFGPFATPADSNTNMLVNWDNQTSIFTVGQTGVTGSGTGWQPVYLPVHRGDACPSGYDTVVIDNMSFTGDGAYFTAGLGLGLTRTQWTSAHNGVTVGACAFDQRIDDILLGANGNNQRYQLALANGIVHIGGRLSFGSGVAYPLVFAQANGEIGGSCLAQISQGQIVSMILKGVGLPNSTSPIVNACIIDWENADTVYRGGVYCDSVATCQINGGNYTSNFATLSLAPISSYGSNVIMNGVSTGVHAGQASMLHSANAGRFTLIGMPNPISGAIAWSDVNNTVVAIAPTTCIDGDTSLSLCIRSNGDILWGTSFPNIGTINANGHINFVFNSISSEFSMRVDTHDFRPDHDATDDNGVSSSRWRDGWYSRNVTAADYLTSANCSSSASPAVCGSASAGSVVVAAAATTVTVNTTAVTANSQIFLQPDDSLGTKLGVTCNTTGTLLDAQAWVSARTAATSFVITVNAAPSVNPECFSYFIVN